MLRLPLIRKQRIQNEQASALEEEFVPIENYFEEDSSLVLQKLMNEEANLLEDKEKLHALLVSLMKKRQLEVQRNIRKKKKSIQRLRVKIKDLRDSCEELSKSLNHARKINS
jgi:hypothetical protein